MTIKEYTEYILNNYQNEVIKTGYDQKGRRKNVLKSQNKFEKIKNITEDIFKMNSLKTEFKYGLDFNYSDMPWIFMHDDYNVRATKQDYIGISFNKENNALELWIGFGKNGMKKNERKERQKLTTQRYKTICPTLERNFRYLPIFEEEATILSKSVLLDEINDISIKKDLEYLEQIYLKYIDKFIYNNVNIENNSRVSEELNEEVQTVDLPKNKKIEGINLIYKGFPGNGKSYLVKNTYLTEKDDNGNIIYENNKPKLINEYQYEIVVFYPEYTNSNFIGSILPVYNDGIKYTFVPGPFTKILKRAIQNPKTNFYLIIEEINRGNAEAIFGDILLLLDRENDGNGRSTYEITNEFVSQEIYNDKNKKIYIPENLSIIATMNSSDQNVCVLDTAFERRWDTIWVTDKKEEIDKMYIKGFGNLKWGDFRSIINTEIKNCTTMLQMEDKKLGAYFINNSFISETPSNREKDRLRFTYKVLSYLFDNVCKYDKKLLFNDNIKCIDDLIKSVINKEIIFNDAITNKIKEKTNE